MLSGVDRGRAISLQAFANRQGLSNQKLLPFSNFGCPGRCEKALERVRWGWAIFLFPTLLFVTKENKMKLGLAMAVAVAMCLTTAESYAQCSTCAVPQVAYSPVVYNNYTTTYDGWYLGKYVGRLGRRVFGTAPAPAYQVGYPTTYAAGYAPTYSYASYAPTYAASYAPSCNTCGTSPCCCAQTTYRPIVMSPVSSCCTCPTTCNTCGTCDTCSGVTQAGYNTSVSSSCPTCNTSTYIDSSASNASQAPSLNNSAPAPQQTFRETERLDPTPAEETGVGEQASDFGAPLLLDPSDKLTKRPTSPVWTAVYKQPATIKSVSATQSPAKTQSVGWTAGR